MTINWGLLQLGVFLSTFCAFVAAERLWPRRALAIELVSRWSANMGFTVVNAVVGTIVHFVVPIAVVAEAIYVEEHGYGLFPAIAANLCVAVPVTIAALDFALYAFHVTCHKLPLLWRFHRVHHLDLEVDTTTAFRAHPFEYVFSQFLKLIVIYALGAPVVAVVAYEVLLNVFAMFSHSNIGISERSDRWLRRFIVTPDMHRVHHSSYQPETDSNYGVVTPLWDRMFGTYTAATREAQTTMKLGLDEVRGAETHNLFWLLGSPAVSFDTRPATDRLPNEIVGAPVTTSLRTPT